MRKEVLFAIIAGGLFGLLIAFGIWRANQALTPDKATSNQKNEEKQNKDGFAIAIATPSNSQVSTQDSIEISGTTKPQSIVVVSGEKADYILDSDSRGAFKTEVDLEGGVNQLAIIAFDSLNNSTEKTLLTLVYSSEFEANASSEEKESTTDAVRQKVQEKITEITNKPLAYMGTVTDITSSTLQIKNDEGEIQQIALKDEDITYVKITSATKVVKFQDLAIGDYIVAMGYRNGNGVLNARRVLITSPIIPTTRTAAIGTVIKFEKNKITLKDKETTVETSSTTSASLKEGDKITRVKVTSIEEENKIVAVGAFKDNIFSARKIFIVK